MKRLTLWVVLCFVCACAPEPRATRPAEPQAFGGDLGWSHRDAPAPGERFSFAILADRTGGHQPGVWAKAIEDLNRLQPNFVMSVGDLTERGKPEEWDEFQQLIEPLEAPFCFVPGNHDLWSPTGPAQWKDRVGPTYGHFVYGDVLFLVVDSLEIDREARTVISQKQVDALAAVLAANADVKWTCVFTHIPLWRWVPGRGQLTSNFPKIEALLADRPYTVFAGHEHQYLKQQRNGRDYYVLCTTGGYHSGGGPAEGLFHHTTWVTMTDDGPKVAVLPVGTVYGGDVRTPDWIEQYEQLLRDSGVFFQTFTLDEQEAGRRAIVVKNSTEGDMSFELFFEPSEDVKLSGRQFRGEATSMQERVYECDPKLQGDVKPALVKPAKVHARWTLNLPGRPPMEFTRVIGLASETELTLHVDDENAFAIDGKLDEWGDLQVACDQPAEIQKQPEAWTGPEDCRFDFDVALRDGFICIAVDVTDDELLGKGKGRVPWASDGVEIRIDARAEPVRATGIRSHEAHGEILAFLLCPGETAEETVWIDKDKLPEGCKAACVRTDKGFAAEIAVPEGYLAERQHVFQRDGTVAVRVNVAVGDRDADGMSQLWWRPDWRGENSWAGSGTFDAGENSPMYIPHAPSPGAEQR